MAEQSSIGNHLAELYNSIPQHQQEIEDAKAVVKEKEAALEKVKGQFAAYLKELGIDKLLAPVQADLFSAGTKAQAPKLKAEGKERKPRTSSADKQAAYDINKATYKPENYAQYNGVNNITGVPIRFKGNSPKNKEIDAQMMDDKRDYEARNQDSTNSNEPEPQAEAPKSEAKPKAKAAAAK